MRFFLSSLCIILVASSASMDVCVAGVSRFIRGDADGEGYLAMSDAVLVLRFLFPSAPGNGPSIPCLDAADANDDGRLNVTDAIYSLNHLFRGGPAPPAPFPRCGEDPSGDALGCENGPNGCMQDDFYGLTVEQNGVVFIVDTSRFMLGNGELSIAMREIVRYIVNARPGVEIGIVFFDGAVHEYPATGKPFLAQDVAAVSDAVVFISDIAGGGDACVNDGLHAGLAFAEASTASEKVLLYVGCGAGVCGEELEPTYLDNALKEVAAENAGRVSIYTIGELVRSDLRDHFLNDLASRNRGEYVRIDRR